MPVLTHLVLMTSVSLSIPTLLLRSKLFQSLQAPSHAVFITRAGRYCKWIERDLCDRTLFNIPSILPLLAPLFRTVGRSDDAVVLRIQQIMFLFSTCKFLPLDNALPPEVFSFSTRTLVLPASIANICHQTKASLFQPRLRPWCLLNIVWITACLAATSMIVRRSLRSLKKILQSSRNHPAKMKYSVS